MSPVRRKLYALAVAVILGMLRVSSALSLTLPASLTAIGDEAFCGAALQEVTVPSRVTEIGARAFAGSDLQHITIPASVGRIGDGAFDDLDSSFFATVTPGSYAETWCKANSIAYSYTDDPYTPPTVSAQQAALAGFLYLGTPYSRMDCQAFVEQCLNVAGLSINLAGSNAWYRAMDWTGTPEECIEALGFIPPGAFLFILENDGGEPAKYKADGLGNASHIGLVTGIGKGAIHSSYSRGGVYESEFKGRTINGGWNRVGLWKRVSYGDAVDRWLTLHGK